MTGALWGPIIVGAVIVLLGVAILANGRVQRLRGIAEERERQARASAENLRKRIATDDELSRLAPDEIRRRLDGWTADDPDRVRRG